MRTGIFTDRRIGEFIHGSSADYLSERRVINGVDRAKDIAEYAKKFERILFSSVEN